MAEARVVKFWYRGGKCHVLA